MKFWKAYLYWLKFWFLICIGGVGGLYIFVLATKFIRERPENTLLSKILYIVIGIFVFSLPSITKLLNKTNFIKKLQNSMEKIVSPGKGFMALSLLAGGISAVVLFIILLSVITSMNLGLDVLIK